MIQDVHGRGRRRLRHLGVPMTYALLALAAGVLVPRIEARFFPDLTGTNTSGAIAVLSAIASGTLPLTGLVFSLAFVMVQFSATAYSPRLVAWLAGSSVMLHSLGAFVATFLYALAALAWVDRARNGKVPLLTVGLALALLLVSVVFFILLIERLAMLQISRVLGYVGDQGRSVIALMYPAANAAGPPDAADTGAAGLPPATQVVRHSGGPAVIQAIDLKRLPAVAARHDAVIAMAAAVGDTLAEGMPLLRVHGASRPIRDSALRRCVKLGFDRTFEQDPKYALRLLVDIAIRALSPAVNDPTTAVQALDQIEDLLIRLGARDLSAAQVRDAGGRVRLVYPSPSWDDFIVLAFDEIRYCGANSIQVMRRMRALLRSVMEHVPAERCVSLQSYLERVDAGIARAFEDQHDRRDALEADRQGLGLSQERRQG